LSLQSRLNWGLALALGPIVAVHFAGEAERRGIPIDFPFLLAVNGGAGSVWQFGLSASGPLLMATSGHFLETITGTMSLLSTIWSPAALALVITFPVAVIFVARLLMPGHPQHLSQFPQPANSPSRCRPRIKATPASRKISSTTG
jgi:short-chain fatty acids transporter